MKRILKYTVALLLLAAACDDPVAPLPIRTEQVELEFRDVYVYENGGLAEQYVEFGAVVADTVSPSKLDSVVEMEVLWPNGVTRVPIPPTFHLRQDGRRGASAQLPREQGLFDGMYTLTVRFADGREAVVEQQYNTSRRVGPATNLSFQREPTWAAINWRGPGVLHEWSIRLERRLPEPVDTVLAGPFGSARGGGYGAGFDYDFEAGVTYAFVLEIGNEVTRRLYTYVFQD